MLDLQPRIGLDESERLIVTPGVIIDQEFEGAEVVVTRGGRELFGGLDDARTQGVLQ